jgi:hypothetical protein
VCGNISEWKYVLDQLVYALGASQTSIYNGHTYARNRNRADFIDDLAEKHKSSKQTSWRSIKMLERIHIL